MKTSSLKLSSVSMTFRQIQGNNTPKLCFSQSFSLLSSSVFWLFFLVSYLFPFSLVCGNAWETTSLPLLPLLSFPVLSFSPLPSTSPWLCVCQSEP